ncbi:MAG: RNA polymerase factor sigma-54 [Rhodocyclaceae bacterium]|nr:RNA polymerase factor sigma-54 [Rhodocyclaceae bacterium]
MKQALQLRVSQHLALTPQLQQAIRLLQLSTLELNAEIEQALHDNPMLERIEAGDPGYSPGQSGDQAAPETLDNPENGRNDDADSPFEGLSDEGWGAELDTGSRPHDFNDEDMDSGRTQSASVTLTEHLTEQLGLTQLNSRDRTLVGFLIEALDGDGYLTQSLEELSDILPVEDIADETAAETHENLLADLKIALLHLQHFDPPGIGARDCRECLQLQLSGMPVSPTRELAQTLVMHHLDLLAARDFVRIRKSLGCEDIALKEAMALIGSLNPRPGAAFTPLATRYVVPDVSVIKLRHRWVCKLNGDAMPRLRINRLYANILQRQRSNTAANGGLNAQLQEAKWLIKNVQQRFDTILRVSQAIVDRQKAFFDHGEVAMRPLTLREIAEIVELHESTISRVTTQKYIASPRGIFELKYFFGSHVATDTGGAASSTAIRALIKQLVGAEDGRKPLSDARLAEVLGEQGIVVARRTVAKYRELLSIPPVNQRKTL